jgi:hypothetical protein
MSFNKMKILFRFAIIATFASALLWFFLSNTALALTSGNYCIVLFEVPFTEKAYRLPYWMWGKYPLVVSSILSVAAIGFWIVWGVKHLRARRPANSYPASPN